MSSISILTPAYNEEHSLESSVKKTLKTFKDLKLDFEIIIVDDFSEDHTWDIAVQLSDQSPRIQAVRLERHQGQGDAFRKGIMSATKEFVIFVPVDNPMDTDDIEAYLKRIDVCDIIVGVRAERVGYTSLAQFLSFVYNRILIPLMFNIGFSDVNWIQMYRRELFINKTLSYESTSFFWLVEVLVNAKRNRLIIVEVPAKMKKRIYGTKTNTRIPVLIKTFFDMLRYFWKIQMENRR